MRAAPALVLSLLCVYALLSRGDQAARPYPSTSPVRPVPPGDCICTLQYDPVCGSDGKTYSNNCFAACAGVKVVSQGECPTHPSSPPPSDECICILIFAPVCGSDGKTYDNACFAGCAGVKVVSQGECPRGSPPPEEGCVCPAVYIPVCGADGKTYGNACEAGCAKVKVVSEGECPTKQPCICTKEYKPVCGSDGNTYANKCFAECAGVKYKDGACKERGPSHLCHQQCRTFSGCGNDQFGSCMSHCQRSYQRPECCGSYGCKGGKKCVYGKCK